MKNLLCIVLTILGASLFGAETDTGRPTFSALRKYHYMSASNVKEHKEQIAAFTMLLSNIASDSERNHFLESIRYPLDTPYTAREFEICVEYLENGKQVYYGLDTPKYEISEHHTPNGDITYYKLPKTSRPAGTWNQQLFPPHLTFKAAPKSSIPRLDTAPKEGFTDWDHLEIVPQEYYTMPDIDSAALRALRRQLKKDYNPTYEIESLTYFPNKHPMNVSTIRLTYKPRQIDSELYAFPQIDYELYDGQWNTHGVRYHLKRRYEFQGHEIFRDAREPADSVRIFFEAMNNNGIIYLPEWNFDYKFEEGMLTEINAGYRIGPHRYFKIVYKMIWGVILSVDAFICQT